MLVFFNNLKDNVLFDLNLLPDFNIQASLYYLMILIQIGLLSFKAWQLKHFQRSCYTTLNVISRKVKIGV